MKHLRIAASHSFPYVKKRIQVVYHIDVELSPIEVAIDAMQTKVSEIEEVLDMKKTDLKKLQLKLQGSVSVTVISTPDHSTHSVTTCIFILRQERINVKIPYFTCCKRIQKTNKIKLI